MDDLRSASDGDAGLVTGSARGSIAWWFGDIDFPRREAEAIMRAYPGETGRSVRCECLWKNDSADANLSPKEIDFLDYALWWR